MLVPDDLPTLESLLAQAPLRLSSLVAGDPALRHAAIRWAHSTDLPDPTPFLEPGTMVLTTGTQFVTDPDAAAYVARLGTAGVVAIGFGTEVVRAGTPEDLVEACARSGLPLVEVPYSIPFVAIASHIADRTARARHARADWGIAVVRSLAQAAHRPDGLGAVLATLAERIEGGIALVEADRVRAWRSDGAMVSALALERSPWPQVVAESRRLLAAGARAATAHVDHGAHVSLFTLGGTRALRGVLARVAAEAPDVVESGVFASATALAGLALGQPAEVAKAAAAVRSAVCELLLLGQVEAAQAAAAHLPGALPGSPAAVVRCEGIDAAALHALLGASAAWSADRADGCVAILAASAMPTLKRLPVDVEEGWRLGLSQPHPLDGLEDAAREAELALTRAPDRGLCSFDQIKDDPWQWLAAHEGADAVATALLAPVEQSDATLIPALTTWLESGCQWDPAARTLGMHRHTLRKHIDRAGELLQRDLTSMDARAEVWWALRVRDGEARHSREGGTRGR